MLGVIIKIWYLRSLMIDLRIVNEIALYQMSEQLSTGLGNHLQYRNLYVAINCITTLFGI